MQMSHSLLQCPLYNCATLTLDTNTRIITHSSTNMMRLLDNDLTGTHWPSKQDQQLCFTTLVKIKSSQQHKRLLTCEHVHVDDPAMTTIYCAELSRLDTTSAFFYALTSQRTSQFKINHKPTIILRLSSYGVIQSVFISPTTHSFPTTPNWMIGQPLMRFIHNDDIPILCRGLRQVTRYQQDDTDGNNRNSNNSGHGEDWTDKDDIAMVSFDIRCNFDNNSLQNHGNIDGGNSNSNSSNSEDHDRLYHFSVTVTSSQDLLFVIRPTISTANNNNNNNVSSLDTLTETLSPEAPSVSYSRTRRIPRTMTTSPSSSSSSSSFTCHYGMPRVYSALIHLSQMVQSPYSKGKDMVSGLQQALWVAVEQGWMMLAHYLAVVMVLALQYYRMARYPSFWLETSELALRCLVTETTSRHELDRLFSWLDWSGLHQQPWLDSALDHGSEWLFSLSSRSHACSF